MKKDTLEHSAVDMKADSKSKEYITNGHYCACFNLRKAARSVTQMYDEALRPAGVRGTQFALLMAVQMVGPLTVNQLADSVVMDRTTLSRNLKLIENQGLVSIEPGKDKRERMVNLTPAGEAVLEKSYPYWENVQADIVNKMGLNEFERLLELLNKTVMLSKEG